MAKRSQRKTDDKPMFFSAFNYKLIGIAIFLIVSGFAAMYIENEVNGFISLYLSPIVVMIGYVIVIFAIMKHDRDEQPEADQETAA
jgi:amino acid permease